MFVSTDLISISNVQSADENIIKIELITKETVADYLLYDMTGKLIEKGKIEGIKQFSGFAKGVYMLVVKTTNATDVKKIQF